MNKPMNKDEKEKKHKVKKPGQWQPLDIIIGIVAIIILGALTIAAFKIAQWAVKTYM